MPWHLISTSTARTMTSDGISRTSSAWRLPASSSGMAQCMAQKCLLYPRWDLPSSSWRTISLHLSCILTGLHTGSTVKHVLSKMKHCFVNWDGGKTSVLFWDLRKTLAFSACCIYIPVQTFWQKISMPVLYPKLVCCRINKTGHIYFVLSKWSKCTSVLKNIFFYIYFFFPVLLL